MYLSQDYHEYGTSLHEHVTRLLVISLHISSDFNTQGDKEKHYLNMHSLFVWNIQDQLSGDFVFQISLLVIIALHADYVISSLGLHLYSGLHPNHGT